MPATIPGTPISTVPLMAIRVCVWRYICGGQTSDRLKEDKTSKPFLGSHMKGIRSMGVFVP